MRGQYLISIALYLTYLGLLLYLTLFVFPEASKMLREREAFADLLLDEEFSVNASDVAFKKTFGDVMTTQVRKENREISFANPFNFSPTQKRSSFYQDRLGTNIGRERRSTQKERCGCVLCL
jgi:hypothetical protein